MTNAAPKTDPVKLARIAADKRVALITAAARQQDKIKSVLAKLDAERITYAETYRAALDAWSKTELDDFGLMAPDQLAKPSTPTKRTGGKASPAEP